MKIFPAIDILGGKAVRLYKGDRSAVTVYGDPVEKAYAIAAAGGKYLHVVDLDAAFGGSIRTNDRILREIAAVKGLTVQLGGGIRTEARAAHALEKIGVSRIIIGSVIATKPKLAQRIYGLYGTAVVGGLDVKHGGLAVKGWQQTTAMLPLDAALWLKEIGAADIVFTDISRDGALTGINAGLTQRMQVQSGLNVIASGGLASIDDIKTLKALGVYGAILGKAMYDGAIDLKEALLYAESTST